MHQTLPLQITFKDKSKRNKTIIFEKYETWSHSLRKEHGVMMSDNRTLRIFGCKRNTVIGGTVKCAVSTRYY
jgi:hypothetical protein